MQLNTDEEIEKMTLPELHSHNVDGHQDTAQTQDRAMIMPQNQGSCSLVGLDYGAKLFIDHVWF